MLKYDLHTHTKYSDGELDILGNIKRAKELGLSGIAITDHDNLDSWKDIDSNNYDFYVIKGVELSTYYNGVNIHILGYYLNDDGSYSELEQFLAMVREKRKERVYKVIDLLKNFEIELTYEEIASYADGAIGRPHIAQAIINKYPERNYSMNEVFDKYIGNNAPAYVKSFNFETKDAIDMLKRNHCLVVLAHPLFSDKYDYKEIFDLGIDGIEVFYPYTEHKNYEEVLNFAKDNDLIITGGSDYHGPFVRNSMGEEFLEEPYIIEFLKDINIKN